MTITISSQAYSDLWNAANEMPQHSEPSDLLDMTWKQSPELGEGYVRDIQLRDGLCLTIAHNQFYKKQMGA